MFEPGQVPCLFSVCSSSSIELPVIAFMPSLSRLEQTQKPLKHASLHFAPGVDILTSVI